MKKNMKKPAATNPAKAPSKPDKPCRAPSAGNPAPTPAPRLKRAPTGRGAAGATKPTKPARDLDAETRAYGDELARREAEDERARRWRSLLQVERPETGGEDGARRADFARQAAEALGWPGWATYERTGRFDPLRGNLPLLYATAAVDTVTARPFMRARILAALRKCAKPIAKLARIRAAATAGATPGEWYLLDYAGPSYEIPEPRPGTEYARLVAAREAQEAAAAQVLTDAAAGRLVAEVTKRITHADEPNLPECVLDYTPRERIRFQNDDEYAVTARGAWKDALEKLLHPTSLDGWVHLDVGWRGHFSGSGVKPFMRELWKQHIQAEGKTGRFRLI